MTLPQFANAVFVRDEDPKGLAQVKERLLCDGRFDAVFSPRPNCIAATVALPDGPDIPPVALENGLVFVEGWDRVTEGHDPVVRSNEIAALAEHHPDRLDELPGDFGFAHFSASGAITIVRSCAGLVPLYWAQRGSRLIVTTILGDTKRFGFPDLEPDLMVYGLWSAGWPVFPDGRSHIRGVKVVSPGAALIITKETARTVQYWQPRPQSLPWPKPGQLDSQAEELKGLLIKYLRRHLHPDGGNLLTLSGGIDSTSLAALVVKELKLDICCWSLLPEKGPVLDAEMFYIEPLLKELAINQTWQVPYESDMLYRLVEESPENVFPTMHAALCDLPRIQRESPVAIKVLFGGEFADNVCGSAYTFSDWVMHVSWFRLLTRLHRLPSGRRSLKRYVRLRWLRARGKAFVPLPEKLPAFVPDSFQAEYHSWLAEQRAEAATDPLPLANLHKWVQHDWPVMNWEGTSPLGIRRAVPFFHREVLELAYRCHPVDLIGPNDTKLLLRKALRGIARDQNLDRPDKGGWGKDHDFFHKTKDYDIQIPSEINQYLNPTWMANNFPRMTYPEADNFGRYVKYLNGHRTVND